jgi:hypothetical protein
MLDFLTIETLNGIVYAMPAPLFDRAKPITAAPLWHCAQFSGAPGQAGQARR